MARDPSARVGHSSFPRSFSNAFSRPVTFACGGSPTASGVDRERHSLNVRLHRGADAYRRYVYRQSSATFRQLQPSAGTSGQRYGRVRWLIELDLRDKFTDDEGNRNFFCELCLQRADSRRLCVIHGGMTKFRAKGLEVLAAESGGGPRPSTVGGPRADRVLPMAGREGFEPSREFHTPYPLSTRTLSTTH